MKRFIYATLVGLVLAGIVHILIILLIPSYAAKDAWATLAQKSEPWTFNIVANAGAARSELPLVDPTFGVTACRFNLGEAPLSVRAIGEAPFWSVAIFDRRGQNIYSFNDRTAIERSLFLIVVNSVQMAQLRKSPPEDSEKAVLVQADIKEGFVLIRALQPDASWSTAVSSFLSSARCDRYLELAEPASE